MSDFKGFLFKLQNGECRICEKNDVSVRRTQIFGGNNRNGYKIYCNCEIMICVDCMATCGDCGFPVKSEVVEKYLAFRGNNCQLNPCNACNSLSFCNCKNK